MMQILRLPPDKHELNHTDHTHHTDHEYSSPHVPVPHTSPITTSQGGRVRSYQGFRALPARVDRLPLRDRGGRDGHLR